MPLCSSTKIQRRTDLFFERSTFPSTSQCKLFQSFTTPASVHSINIQLNTSSYQISLCPIQSALLHPTTTLRNHISGASVSFACCYFGASTVTHTLMWLQSLLYKMLQSLSNVAIPFSILVLGHTYNLFIFVLKSL